jgi:hypothetical protein
MTYSIIQAEANLAKAFDALFTFVSTMAQTGATEADAPTFTYVMTQKQMDELGRVCTAQSWPIVNCPGILISVDAVMHPIHTRQAKDGCTSDEVKTLITKAYSHRSIVRVNRYRGQEGIFLNTQQKVIVGGATYYAMAILKIESEPSAVPLYNGTRNYLAPVTVYHANEAKKRAIERG